jgi:hypothetical protein
VIHALFEIKKYFYIYLINLERRLAPEQIAQVDCPRLPDLLRSDYRYRRRGLFNRLGAFRRRELNRESVKEKLFSG